MNFNGRDICLFATVFLHRRPNESRSERTDLRHSRDTELPPTLRHRTVPMVPDSHGIGWTESAMPHRQTVRTRGNETHSPQTDIGLGQ
jgi:hypothetical protein